MRMRMIHAHCHHHVAEREEERGTEEEAYGAVGELRDKAEHLEQGLKRGVWGISDLVEQCTGA